ncbi:MAG: DUF2520 domain-containing protein [Terriglobales bacterium]
MDWIVVGNGRVGRALSAWQAKSGTSVRAPISHRGFAGFLRTLARQPRGGLLLAVPDDALPEVARRLAAARPDWSGWCVLHTSGARPAAVLHPLARRGAAVGAMHPMMTFTHAPPPPPLGIVFSLEGQAAACRAAGKLVAAWGGLPLPLSAAGKAAYHLAATLVGPGAVVNMAAAEMILKRAGFGRQRLRLAQRGLLRLLRTTAANLEAGPAHAWTGPWARGDSATLARQRRLLPTPALRRLYAGIEATVREQVSLKSARGSKQK